MSKDNSYEFEAFMDEVDDILPLSTQNPQSLQKSKNLSGNENSGFRNGKMKILQEQPSTANQFIG